MLGGKPKSFNLLSNRVWMSCNDRHFIYSAHLSEAELPVSPSRAADMCRNCVAQTVQNTHLPQRETRVADRLVADDVRELWAYSSHAIWELQVEGHCASEGGLQLLVYPLHLVIMFAGKTQKKD